MYRSVLLLNFSELYTNDVFLGFRVDSAPKKSILFDHFRYEKVKIRYFDRILKAIAIYEKVL